MGLREAATMVVGDYDLHGPKNIGFDALAGLKQSLPKTRNTGSVTTIPKVGESLYLDTRGPCTTAKIGDEVILNVTHETDVHLALQILASHSANALEVR